MANSGLMIVAYTAEPGSRSAEAFALLASWAATEDAKGLPVEARKPPREAASE
jgi:hypothetical protein